MSLTTNAEGYQPAEVEEASGSNSRPILRRHYAVLDLAAPSISLRSPERADYDDDCRVISTTDPNLPEGYLAWDVQTGAILENEENGEETGEARDQFAMPQSTSIDVELDYNIVSDFVDEIWDNLSPARSPGLSVHGLLHRTSTMRSFRSALSPASLSRTFTSMSTWSTDLDAVHHWEFSLEGWAEFLRNHPSLRSAEIVKVDRYVQQTIVPHRFLVLQLRRANKSRIIFLRLDRRPVPGSVGFVLGLGVTPANDCALLAADEKRAVRGNTPANVEILCETSITFSNVQPTPHHLERMLDAMSLKMAQYQLTKENCWFFCAVCLTKLYDTFGGHFMLGKLDHVGLPAPSKLRAPIYSDVLAPPLLHTISTPPDVLSIAVSPDGNHIVSGHLGGSIRLWDVQTGTAVVKPLKGHTNKVNSVVFSPNGRWIVSGSSDNTIRLYDAKTRATVGKPLRGHNESVLSVAFSPDGERIVSGSVDKTVRRWDRATGTAIGMPSRIPYQGYHAFSDHDIYSVTFSPDGQTIASGSYNRIQLWDATTGDAIGQPFTGHKGCVLSVAFSPSGRHIASGSRDHTARIWNIATGCEICEPLEHAGDVESVAFSPDGRCVASGSKDKTIRFWDAMSGDVIGVPLRAHSHHISSISYFPDGRRIASCGGVWLGSDDKIIHIWDVPLRHKKPPNYTLNGRAHLL